MAEAFEIYQLTSIRVLFCMNYSFMSITKTFVCKGPHRPAPLQSLWRQIEIPFQVLFEFKDGLALCQMT